MDQNNQARLPASVYEKIVSLRDVEAEPVVAQAIKDVVTGSERKDVRSIDPQDRDFVYRQAIDLARRDLNSTEIILLTEPMDVIKARLDNYVDERVQDPLQKVRLKKALYDRVPGGTMMDGTMILTGAADRNYDYLARTARVDVAEQDRAARIAQTMDHEYMAAQGESHEVNEGLQRQANIEVESRLLDCQDTAVKRHSSISPLFRQVLIRHCYRKTNAIELHLHPRRFFFV